MDLQTSKQQGPISFNLIMDELQTRPNMSIHDYIRLDTIRND